MALPGSVKIAISVTGIWSCFLAYGVLQEGIWKYKSPGGDKFTQTLVLLLIEHGASALISLIIMFAFGQRSKQTYSGSMIKNGCIVALAQVSAKFSSNESLKHVSYIIQALAKSSKTIPAMLGSLWSGKKFSVIQWISAAAITGGCAIFSTSGKKGGAVEASAVGIGLLCLSLLCDGTVASCQEKMRGYKVPLSAYEQMFMTNFGAVLLLLCPAVATGQATSGLEFLKANPEVLKSIGMFSACSAFGQIFIFVTIVWFGPGVNAKITTIRKMVTVLLSIVWYGHKLSTEQWTCVGCVFAAVAAELVEQMFSHKPKVEDSKKKK